MLCGCKNGTCGRFTQTNELREDNNALREDNKAHCLQYLQMVGSSMDSTTYKRGDDTFLFQNIPNQIKRIRKRIKDKHCGFAVICYLVIVR